MKFFIAMVLMLNLSGAQAFEIRVSKMKRAPGYKERYDLVTDFNHKIVLDCQSFIQGLLFGPVGDEALMLQEWECDELLTEMKGSLRGNKHHCLEVDLQRGAMDWHESCL